jgi:hypothetical protein
MNSTSERPATGACDDDWIRQAFSRGAARFLEQRRRS